MYVLKLEILLDFILQNFYIFFGFYMRTISITNKTNLPLNLRTNLNLSKFFMEYDSTHLLYFDCW